LLFGKHALVFQAGVGTSRSRSRLVEARTFDKLQAVALAARGPHQRRMVPPVIEDPMIALGRHVPEPEEWTAAKSQGDDAERGSITALFRAPLRRITLLSMVVCASGLTGWWAFMFWHNQHIRNLPELASLAVGDREKALSMVFAGVIGLSVVGNFFCGWLAQRFGYRKSIFWMFAGLGLSCAAAHIPESSSFSTLWKWYVTIGFFSGVFGLFTMYLPPLFPTLQRTTGAGFCYNIGRIAAAAGTVYFGLFSSVGDFRGTLLAVSVIFIPGMIAVLFMPEPTE